MGRPAVDRVLSNEELLQIFKQKIRLQFYKINEKFAKDPKRTDKYRTMVVRKLKRTLAEVMVLIGIDSYAKSPKVERCLPEFEKRFEKMRQLIRSFGAETGSPLLSGVLDDDSQCLVHLSFSFYTLYVSKEKCQEMAASVGISESVANSLLSTRDQTALKDFKLFSEMNPFFRPFLAFCSALMADEMHKF